MKRTDPAPSFVGRMKGTEQHPYFVACFLTEEERAACDEAKRTLGIANDADLILLGLDKVVAHAEVRTSARAFAPLAGRQRPA